MENGLAKIALPTLDWNDLKYFLAVARCGSLTAAAQQLNTSASTVSRHIDALEKQLGVTLFLRQQSGYTLTDDGQDLLQPIISVEHSMLVVTRHSDSLDGANYLQGKVRLAAPDALSMFLITPQLDKFWQRYPHLQVELLTGADSVDLNRREADIALRLVNPVNYLNQQDYIGICLGKLQFSAYCSADLLVDPKMAWPQLAQRYEYIAWNSEWNHLPMMNWLQQLFGDKPPRLSSNNFLIHYQAVLAGLGIAILPDYMVQHEPRLRRIALPDSLSAQRELWVVYHRDLKTSRRVIAVRDFLKDVLTELS